MQEFKLPIIGLIVLVLICAAQVAVARKAKTKHCQVSIENRTDGVIYTKREVTEYKNFVQINIVVTDEGVPVPSGSKFTPDF